jgi:Family of unknown function (DUF6267)
MQDIREIVNKLESLNETIVKEDKGHLDHPEDAIFIGGSQYAKAAVNAIVATVQNPDVVTIKWDGYPALIFGRGPNGKFAIMDKHMFNKKDGVGRIAYTPDLFRKYDLERGVDRSELHQIISNIWQGLSSEDRGQGYYWGDLLFSQPLQEENGLYKFRANPNGITYIVDADSEVGKLMSGKIAGIAVHQYIKPTALSTDEASSLNGSIGQLQNNSNVAIVPSKMPVQAKLKYSEQQRNKALQLIDQYGTAVDQLMVAPQGCKSYLNSNLFTSFINQKVRQGNFNNLLKDFVAFAQGKQITDSVRNKIFGYIDPTTKKKVPGHFEVNKQGLIGAFMIWSAIYNLKSPVVKQLDKASKSSPVKGYLQDGTQTQEGYVAHGFKFVDRMGFSRQNLLGR